VGVDVGVGVGVGLGLVDGTTAVGVKSLGGVCPGSKVIEEPKAAGSTARFVRTGASVNAAVFAAKSHKHPGFGCVTIG
jgi:hypothetical protein